MSSESKILVIGSSATSQNVTSAAWSELSNLNLTDFDAMVVNVDSYKTEKITWGSKIEGLDLRQLLRFLFASNGEVLVIGAPNSFDYEPGGFGTLRGGSKYTHNPMAMFPFYLYREDESGTSVTVTDATFDGYFENVHAWNSSAEPVLVDFNRDLSELASIVEVSDRMLWASHEPIAVNGGGRLIGFSILCELGQYASGNWRCHRRAVPIHFLPAPTEISIDEAIDELLSHRFGVAVKTSSPTWTNQYSLPDEEAAMEQVRRTTDGISSLKDELVTHQHALDHESRFGALLYEKGETLEMIVRDALTVLGANVTPPEGAGRDDGRIAYGGMLGMLEIKGRENSIKLQDIRQLNHWVTDTNFELEAAGQFKGIFVANAHRLTDPSQRGDAFPSNAAQAASRSDIACITTIDLYSALRSHQQGDFDPEPFWRAIFGGKGVISFSW